MRVGEGGGLQWVWFGSKRSSQVILFVQLVPKLSKPSLEGQKAILEVFEFWCLEIRVVSPSSAGQALEPLKAGLTQKRFIMFICFKVTFIALLQCLEILLQEKIVVSNCYFIRVALFAPQTQLFQSHVVLWGWTVRVPSL